MNWCNLLKAFAIVFGTVLSVVLLFITILHVDTWGKYVILIIISLTAVLFIYDELEQNDND